MTPADLKTLLDGGEVEIIPQTYHDFLPFSATAIFRANLTEGVQGISEAEPTASGNRRRLEDAMGVAITNRHDLHRRDQDQSLQEVLAELDSRLSGVSSLAVVEALV